MAATWTWRSFNQSFDRSVAATWTWRTSNLLFDAQYTHCPHVEIRFSLQTEIQNNIGDLVLTMNRQRFLDLIFILGIRFSLEPTRILRTNKLIVLTIDLDLWKHRPLLELQLRGIWQQFCPHWIFFYNYRRRPEYLLQALILLSSHNCFRNPPPQLIIVEGMFQNRWIMNCYYYNYRRQEYSSPVPIPYYYDHRIRQGYSSPVPIPSLSHNRFRNLPSHLIIVEGMFQIR